jgi:mono/diheme cytochrome c family protein
MRRTSVFSVILGTAFAAVTFSTVGAQQRSANDGVFSADQAKRGEMLYTETCAACHDPALTGGVGPALAGKDFFTAWKEMTVGDLFSKIKNEMPLTAPGTMTPEQTADVIAYILSFNKFPAGAAALAADPAPLKDIKISEPGGAGGAAPAPATGGGGTPAASAGGGAGLYADTQVTRGEPLYMDQCAACHDPKLTGGVGPALAGKEFVGTWKGKTVGDLFAKIKNEMPLTAPGTLTPAQAADIVAFVLSSNHYAAGAELKPDPAALKAVPLGEPLAK